MKRIRDKHKVQIYNQKWHAEHPDYHKTPKAKAARAEWYEQNKDKHKRRAKARYLAIRKDPVKWARLQRIRAEWRAANADKIDEYRRRWRSKNSIRLKLGRRLRNHRI